jgi:ribosomal protein S12 methylthiotransferase
VKTKSRPHKIGLVSLGCAKNLVDTERLLRQLEANRFEIIFDPVDGSKIDTAIINTCGFINDAKQESIDTILQFARAKQNNQIRYLFVMGCMSERYKNKLQEEIPEVDAFFGVNELQNIVRYLGGNWYKELVGERKLTTPSHCSYIKIAEGCDRKCAFCAIPIIRGKHISRPFDEVITEAKNLVTSGVKEINVISQDTTYYGVDSYKRRRLPELLSALAQIRGLEWIRLHYTYPDGFPLEVLEVIKKYPNICNYLDIPLQHISDHILRSMHRGITGAQTRRLIKTIRKTIPGVAIRTTLIVGFPGETNKDFCDLKEFVKESRFDRMGVFTYSHEEDTAAFELKDSVPARIKHQRYEELMVIQEEISRELNAAKLGQIVKVIVDREEDEFYIARTGFDSPEVDNEVLIPRGIPALETGSFYDVRITKTDSFDLFAELK